ncbi:hypothetical protein [Caudoviricetes sp.]|nr:hypothetical protein [Caudoviricetes sp.]
MCTPLLMVPQSISTLPTAQCKLGRSVQAAAQPPPASLRGNLLR